MVCLMKAIEDLYVTEREQWRAWLEKNYSTAKEVWLVYYKAHTGKPSIPYGDSVEEALCFGWIDGIIKKLDDERFGRKFMPRKIKSKWAESNKKRAEKMIRQRKMTEAGMVRIREAKESGEWSTVRVRSKELMIPLFFEEALAKNKKALEYFNNLAPSYKRNFVGWVSDAKQEKTRMKRLAEVISLLEQNKKLPLK
jgi:uncharacterized protein YdeI (YjbR/CyaY-like superfamily)